MIRPNNEVDYFIKDHLGSIRVIVDNNGNVLERNDFYPFGVKMTRANYPVSANNQFLFSGKEALEEYDGWGTKGKGSYDFGARIYYSPFGRFDIPDPLSEKWRNISPYAYCLNNPVRFIDRDGRDPGDFFRTKNAAAKDWGNYYNGASILRGNEFASTIYGIKVDGKSGYSYSIANEGGLANLPP